MKRMITALLALFMVFSLCGCSLVGELDAQDYVDIIGGLVEAGLENAGESEYPSEAPSEVPSEVPSDLPTGEPAQIPSEQPSAEPAEPSQEPSEQPSEELPEEDGVYTTKEDVALYLHVYGHLPSNFITKNEARDLGWSGGSLEPYAPGMCIGGDRFGNYEGLLPEAKGRSYTECDIDTLGQKSRGAKRIVFSNDGLIYYTDDHYESFELLYGEE